MGAATSLLPGFGPPAADRAPDALAAGTPEPLRSQLTELLGAEQVLARAIDLVRYASDASPYRRFPQAVVQPRDVDDVRRLFAFAHESGVPLTLRSGGTSLNGQGQGAGIMLDVRRHWRGVRLEKDGKATQARVRPGTILGYVNRVLAPHGRRLGPDPASTDTATVGGVVANNSGGMRCGVTADSYRTVSALTFVLPSGTVIDTSQPDADARFAAQEPELATGLARLRDEIRGDAELAARIAKKFEIKNTTGYRLCAFLDADEPVEIFRRLLVGSEGTLAFLAEVVFDTVPKPARTTVSWLHFEDIDAAVKPVSELVAAGATAVELMVAPALIAASWSIPGTPEHWPQLPPTSAALLVELGADDDAGLDEGVARAQEVLAGHELLREVAFTRDPHEIEVAWTVREGLQGIVGRLRPAGSAFIIEDVCFPPARLAEAARDLQALLGEHGFLPGVAGHASAGNLHFMLTPAMTDPADRARYERFMEGLVDLVIDRYDGSLKAEHGTGLNMAPFVQREWGPRATEIMWEVKALADPHGVLSPGVLLNRDPEVHLRHLKSTPAIEEETTTCVECGFCEPVCPSRDLTTTPRQRIVIRREMARQPPGSPVQRALLHELQYDVLETCAADGTCRLPCPLGIDTGRMVKQLRAGQHGRIAEGTALALARRWAAVERGARAALGVGHLLADTLGAPALGAATDAARAAVGAELLPRWPSNMPAPAPARLPGTTRAGAAAVYLPACINRIFGAAREGAGELPAALVAVSARAGRPLWVPPDVAGTCCATPWTSKGYGAGRAHMAAATAAALERWSEGGSLPVVIDASSCAQGLIEDVLPLIDEARRPTVLDSIAWVHDELLGRLEVRRRLGRVAVHPTCSARHLGLVEQLRTIAGALADEVDLPLSAGCCGFAGDRGLLHPELPAAALAPEARELAAGGPHDAALCSNRTCEIGLQQATGEAFESFVFALDAATR